MVIASLAPAVEFRTEPSLSRELRG